MRVTVAGAGAWGTALAGVAARARHAVILWTRDEAAAALLRERRDNGRYLPGLRLADGIEATAAVAAATATEMLLVAVPAQAVRQVAERFADVLAGGVPVVVCAKGIERDTGKWMTQVIAECLPGCRAAVLSGPGFARDVAAGLPTAVTLACEDGALAASLADTLATPTFRLYHTQDVRGVEIGGAAKNVLAIASGIVAGRGLGASALAALVARSFAELGRFGRAHGARGETLMGLSGLGDLVLTCTSPQSRNFALGQAIGGGAAPEAAIASVGLAEGVYTARILVELARRAGVEMPIAESVDAVLAGRADVSEAARALLARPQKAEA